MCSVVPPTGRSFKALLPGCQPTGPGSYLLRMQEPPTRARISLPPWLWGGNPRRFLAEAAYHTRDAGDGKFLVQTSESYFRNAPDLVRLRTIAGPASSKPRWSDLGQLVERVEFEAPEELAPVLERRRLKAEAHGELLHVINHQHLLLYALAVEDLPLQSQYFVEFLKSVRFTEEPAHGPFPNAGVHLVEVDPALIQRLKTASVWLRIEHDELLERGDLAHIKELSTDAGHAFESSAGLYDGVVLFDAYLGPLLAAGTPGVWAISVARSFGSIIFDLGTLISGSDGDAAEMLQLISIQGADEVVEFPRLSADAGHEAMCWWVDGLNSLFGIASDLAVFTDAMGDYRPAKHLEAMLTLEQIFRRTTSLLVAHRDANARRTLLFSVLDSMEGVRGTNFLTMCNLKHAERTLNVLESVLPSPAAEILLPAARRAVSALREMQRGFFISRQLGTANLEFALSPEESRSMSKEDAAARYLKVLRDATHGHGADKESARAVTDALLAHHNGNVPHDVGLLGYLYLLDVLAHPDRVRDRLFRNGR